MEQFHREVQAIEGEAKMFIDESFTSLRSAEGAFDMLLNFKHIRSRTAINNQMMQKFKDILVQYEKEVCARKWNEESFLSMLYILFSQISSTSVSSSCPSQLDSFLTNLVTLKSKGKGSILIFSY